MSEPKETAPKTHVLLKFSECWADEFNATGFLAFSKEHWEEYQKNLRAYITERFSFGFGTNQSIEFNDAEELIKAYIVSEITEAEYAFLLKHFARTIRDDFNPTTKEFGVKYEIVDYGLVPYYCLGDLKDGLSCYG